MNRERNNSYFVHGIVIARHDFSETDRILHLFSKEQGKISCIVKGVKKSTSKLAGRVELFSIGDYGLTKGKNLDIIISAENVKHSFLDSAELELLSHYYLTAEFLNKLLAENVPNDSLFEETEKYFSRNRLAKSSFCTYQFLYKSIVLMGYGLSLTDCVVCHRPTDRQNPHLSLERGGLVCRTCLGGVEYFDVSPDIIKLLRYIESVQFNEYQKIAADSKLETELQRIVEEDILYLYHHELKSSQFIRKIKRL